MEQPLTPQLLGELIEKGYTYVISKTRGNPQSNISILLKPVRKKPDLENLPDGYETYHKITQEPLQMVCGIANTIITIDFSAGEDDAYVSDTDVLDDGYFRMDEDFFKQVLESLDDYAVFTTDKKGDVNSWNTGAEKILGYNETEIMGINSSVFFTKPDIERDEHNKELQSAITSGRAIDERFHVRKDGSTFWGSGLVFPLNDSYGTLRGFTKIMRNYAERKEAEKNKPHTER